MVQEQVRARIAELAAEYETSVLTELAAEYAASDGPMLPELEAPYLEAEQEIHDSHLPPLCEGMTVELPPAWPMNS